VVCGEMLVIKVEYAMFELDESKFKVVVSKELFFSVTEVVLDFVVTFSLIELDALDDFSAVVVTVKL
jgi:hypothetical protein